MQKLLLAALCSFIFSAASAQIQKGTVLYERYTRLSGRKGMITFKELSAFVHRFELSFTTGRSLYQQTNDPVMITHPETGALRPFEYPENGEQFSDIILFSDLEKNIMLLQGEYLGKRYLISDSIRRLPWRITGETKEVAGYHCQQAVTRRIEIKRYRRASFGDTTSTYIKADTIAIVAWFTTDIPVNAGPEDFAGQLPGLILELNLGNGGIVYIARSVRAEVDTDKIKPPVKGKKYTAIEFAKEKDRMLKEMYLREERIDRGAGPKG